MEGCMVVQGVPFPASACFHPARVWKYWAKALGGATIYKYFYADGITVGSLAHDVDIWILFTQAFTASCAPRSTKNLIPGRGAAIFSEGNAVLAVFNALEDAHFRFQDFDQG